MNRSRFQTNTSNRKPSSALMLAQILILGITITILAALFVQNLQPTIQIFFLGQKSFAIPLSLAMLIAVAIGAITALSLNAIATWRQTVLMRRAVIGVDKLDQKDKPESKPEPSPATYTDDSNRKKVNQKEEDYVEDEWEEESDEYEEIEDELGDQKKYVDNDPDTVPYGDLLKQKSNPKTSQNTKRDRPPLDAKFMRYTK